MTCKLLWEESVAYVFTSFLNYYLRFRHEKVVLYEKCVDDDNKKTQIAHFTFHVLTSSDPPVRKSVFLSIILYVKTLYVELINEFRCQQPYTEVADTTANSSTNAKNSATSDSGSVAAKSISASGTAISNSVPGTALSNSDTGTATATMIPIWKGSNVYLTPPEDFPEKYWVQACFDTTEVQKKDLKKKDEFYLHSWLSGTIRIV